jgi:hypothetical protein
MEQLILNIINYSNYERIVIVDGENLRGNFLLQSKHHTKKELERYVTLNLTEAYFKHIEKYDKNTLFIFVTKNRYFYKCILEMNKKYQYQNILICYLCIKNIKAEQNELIQQKECWFKDKNEKSHIYCEYDDYMIYYFLYVMNLITNKKIKVILYSNDKEFKNIDNIKRFKKIKYYPFHISLYNITYGKKHVLYKDNLLEKEFKKNLKNMQTLKSKKYTQKSIIIKKKVVKESKEKSIKKYIKKNVNKEKKYKNIIVKTRHRKTHRKRVSHRKHASHSKCKIHRKHSIHIKHRKYEKKNKYQSKDKKK